MSVTIEKLLLTTEGKEVFVDAIMNNSDRFDIFNISSVRLGTQGDDNHDETFLASDFPQDVGSGLVVDAVYADAGNFWPVIKTDTKVVGIPATPGKITFTCTIPNPTTAAITCNQIMYYVDYSSTDGTAKKGFLYGVFPTITKNITDELVFTASLEF